MTCSCIRSCPYHDQVYEVSKLESKIRALELDIINFEEYLKQTKQELTKSQETLEQARKKLEVLENDRRQILY